MMHHPVVSFLWLLVATSAAFGQSRPADDAFARLVPDPTPVLLADGFEFTEGPCWFDGGLVFCDLRQRQIHRWTPDEPGGWTGETNVLVEDSRRAAGITFDPRAPEGTGRLLVTHFERQVTRLDEGGDLTVICERAGDQALGSANDIVVRSDGMIFFTNPSRRGSTSGVYRIDRVTPPDGNGRWSAALVQEDGEFPNGIALSPDETTLYYSQYARNVIYAMTIDRAGAATDVRIFCDLSQRPGAGRCDGMAVDREGNVFATGPGGVWVLAPTGEPLGLIPVEGGASNCGFGGPDGRTLFITAGTSVWRLPTATRGVASSVPSDERPYVIVLGTAQDAGSPQVNSPASHPARIDPARRRYATCLGIVDPASGQRWLIEATPDFREQAWMLAEAPPAADGIRLDGVFLTHAHMGHYTGLMFLGHESMGASDVPVHVMPRMRAFLAANGPWDQLVRYDNIELRDLTADQPVFLTPSLSVTPFLVPHRQEYSEVVGFRIAGPERSVVFIPDIDSWDEWAAMGGFLPETIATCEVALLDGTFYADGEIPGRDMSTFPHPRIVDTMQRLDFMPAAERARLRFVHLNHTNPAQWEESPERAEIIRRGFGVAVRGERFDL